MWLTNKSSDNTERWGHLQYAIKTFNAKVVSSIKSGRVISLNIQYTFSEWALVRNLFIIDIYLQNTVFLINKVEVHNTVWHDSDHCWESQEFLVHMYEHWVYCTFNWTAWVCFTYNRLDIIVQKRQNML